MYPLALGPQTPAPWLCNYSAVCGAGVLEATTSPPVTNAILSLPFSCIGTLRSPSLWRGLYHIDTSTSDRKAIQRNWPGIAKASACFPHWTVPFQSSKGPVSVTSYATTPSHRGFRTAGILGVAPGNMEDLLKLQTWSSKIKGSISRLSLQSQGHDQRAETLLHSFPGVKSMLLRKKGMLEKMSFWVFVTSVYFWGKAHFHSWDQLIGKFFFFFLKSRLTFIWWLVVTQMVLLWNSSQRLWWVQIKVYSYYTRITFHFDLALV